METFFASGHAVDFVLAVLAVELIVLLRRGWSLRDALAMLLPAALMLLGLRAALTGAGWVWVALPLALSLPVHLLDLARRRARQS
ncbi:hypothetical protein [Erythrobacter sp. QSSC1-22B]|uniref:hypothetical protein n=1 Tax=Erythrobacter sp. QSSC1-22B TaxID=1860125 RepID=UPI001F402A04|nr:hypothetical protein [Erythrobacter sp. QSSC1-22B]